MKNNKMPMSLSNLSAPFENLIQSYLFKNFILRFYGRMSTDLSMSICQILLCNRNDFTIASSIHFTAIECLRFTHANTLLSENFHTWYKNNYSLSHTYTYCSISFIRSRMKYSQFLINLIAHLVV